MSDTYTYPTRWVRSDVQRDEKHNKPNAELFETRSYATRNRQPPRNLDSGKREERSPVVRSKVVQVVLTLLLIGLGFLLVLIAMLLHPPFK